MDTGFNVFRNKLGITARNDILNIQPLFNKFQDHIHRYPGSFDAGFSKAGFGVNAYPVFAHSFSTPFLKKDSISVYPSQGKVTFEPIVKIEPLGRLQVYDIEVEGTHNFVAQGIVAHNTYIIGKNGSSSSLEEANTPNLADEDSLERILRKKTLSESDIETLFIQMPNFIIKEYPAIGGLPYSIHILTGIKVKLCEQLSGDVYKRRLTEVAMKSNKILYTNKAKEIFKERMNLLKKVLALSKSNLVNIKEITTVRLF